VKIDVCMKERQRKKEKGTEKMDAREEIEVTCKAKWQNGKVDFRELRKFCRLNIVSDKIKNY